MHYTHATHARVCVCVSVCACACGYNMHMRVRVYACVCAMQCVRVHACVLRHSLTCCPLHYATSHAMIHSPHARVQLQDHSALAPFPTPPLGPPVGHTFPVCPQKYLVLSEASPACWALVTGPPLVGHPVARAPSHLDLAYVSDI